MGIGMLESVLEEEASLEESRRNVTFLQEKQKHQARLLVAWKTRFRHQARVISKLQKERDEHLQSIQSHLLTFETLLKKGRKELKETIDQKDEVIRQQHQLICSLSVGLLKRGGVEELKKIIPGIKVDITTSNSGDKTPTEMDKNSKNKSDKDENNKADLESSNDADSAIMMEDAYDSLIILPSSKEMVFPAHSRL